MNDSPIRFKSRSLTFNELVTVPTETQANRDSLLGDLRRLRQAQQAAHRREQMLDAAFSLFQEVGLQGFNMRELGQRAGYTAGALYAYFDGKAAILDALRDRLLQQLTLELQQSLPKRRSVLRERSSAPIATADHGEGSAALFLQLSQAWWRWLALDSVRWRILLAVDQPVAAHFQTVSERRDAAITDAPSLLQQLCDATVPCRDVLYAAGLSIDQASRLQEESLVRGAGLLVLHALHTDAAGLEERFVEGLRQLVFAAGLVPDDPPGPQRDLFGR